MKWVFGGFPAFKRVIVVLDKFSFLVAIDESGPYERLVSHKDFSIHYPPESDPYFVLGIVVLRSSQRARFNKDWNDITAQIAEELGLDYLPPVHLRLMWGDRKPYWLDKRRGIENPYKWADRVQVKGWIEKAFKVIDKYQREGSLRWFTYHEDVRPIAVQWEQYFKYGDFKKEFEYLKHHVGAKPIRHYLAAVSSPLIHGLSKSIVFLTNSIPSAYREVPRVGVLFDNTQDLVGFETTKALQYFLNRSDEVNYTVLGRLEDAGVKYEQFPLMQASDLVGFFFRKRLNKDPIAAYFIEKYGSFVPRAWRKRRTKEVVKLNPQEAELLSFILRYELGYKRATEESKKFEDLVADPSEFIARIKRKPVRVGVSILKEPFGEEAI